MFYASSTFIGLLSILLLGLSTLTDAADCTVGNPESTCAGNVADSTNQYAARQSFCGDNQWETLSCITYNLPNDNAVTIKLSEPGANTQQVCWDALEDIITQCTGGTGYQIGVYNYNGAQYSLDDCGTPC